MVRLLGWLLSLALFLPGCGGGTLAEEMPSPAATTSTSGSLLIQFDSPLSVGKQTTARGMVSVITARGRQMSTFGPLTAERHEKGLLVSGTSQPGGQVYLRVDEQGITVTWTAVPEED